MVTIPLVSKMPGIQEEKANAQLWNLAAETSGKIFLSSLPLVIWSWFSFPQILRKKKKRNQIA